MYMYIHSIKIKVIYFHQFHIFIILCSILFLCGKKFQVDLFKNYKFIFISSTSTDRLFHFENELMNRFAFDNDRIMNKRIKTVDIEIRYKWSSVGDGIFVYLISCDYESKQHSIPAKMFIFSLTHYFIFESIFLCMYVTFT